jgi:ribosome-binding factor A
MPSYRPARIAELVHREVAARLRQDVKDPELGAISITRVEVPRDLGCAVVFFLPLGGGAVTPAQLEALGRAAKVLRGPVGRALKLRTAPELRFRVDDQHEEAVRVALLLSRLERERAEAAAAEGEE